MPVKRERYTPNDVGPIPIDWDTPLLKDVSSLITNGFVGTATPYYTGSDGVKYLYGTNVRENFIDLKNIRFITKESHKQESKTELRTGDLLTVQSGHIGTTAVVSRELDGANCHALIVSRLHKDKVNSNFLSYYMNSHIGRARMRGLEVGSTIYHINTKDLKKFRVILPPIPEQQKIAQILFTWDKAIEKLETLIAAKQKRKKALMQQLLTGNKRFPEFEGEWKEHKLGELCHFKRGKGLSKEMLISDGKYKCILYGELYTKYDDVIGNVVSRTNEADSIKSVYGDVLIPSSTTTSGIDLANAVALLEDDVLLGGDINILRPNTKKVCSEFLAYLLTHIKKHQIASKAQGATIIHLYGSDLKPLLVKLPDIKEQQKIAAVISTSDNEITTHQNQLAALQQQKIGLMQQLLTGKKRVSIGEVK